LMTSHGMHFFFSCHQWIQSITSLGEVLWYKEAMEWVNEIENHRIIFFLTFSFLILTSSYWINCLFFTLWQCARRIFRKFCPNEQVNADALSVFIVIEWVSPSFIYSLFLLWSYSLFP
jgi:hypothetical protein